MSRSEQLDGSGVVQQRGSGPRSRPTHAISGRAHRRARALRGGRSLFGGRTGATTSLLPLVAVARPRERFAAFWSLVDECLEPAGRVFFVDDAFRPPEELIEGEPSSTIQRRLGDGKPYGVVKVPYRPAELEEQLAMLGLALHRRSDDRCGARAP